MHLIGHRGYPELFPENTLSSFKAAMSTDCVGIELDVRQVKCGELVVIHDATLDRTTSATGKVADYSAEALHEYGVPTLWQVLELFANTNMLILIEAKEPQLGAALVAIIEKAAAELGYDLAQLPVISFQKQVLEDIIKINPAIKRGVSVIGNPDFTEKDSYGFNEKGDIATLQKAFERYTPHYIIPNIHAVCPKMVALCQEHNIEIAAWTIKTKADLELATQANIHYAITNDPAL